MSKKHNKVYQDSRGTLCPIDFEELPFQPRHAFYTTNVPVGEIRGKHAHHKCEQFLICLQGIIVVTLYDGKDKNRVTLLPNQSIHLPPLVWSEQHFTKENSILLVLSSMTYDERDYIRDYNIFKEIINEHRCTIAPPRSIAGELFSYSGN